MGGVVPPVGVIAQIIPRNDDPMFEVRVDPGAIDQVFPVRFPAYNQRITPELNGRVAMVLQIGVQDQATGLTSYRVSGAVPPEELARLGDNDLWPGMPVEAFLQTGERTVIRYLVKPLSEQIYRAFRER